MGFKEFVAGVKERVDGFLSELLKEKIEQQEDPYNKRVYEEIERFVLSPGKRIRPALVVLGYRSVGGFPSDDIYRVSSVFELLHAYLLIHDDVIDRDEMRRGQPTVWKRLEENGLDTHTAFSLAILAGDITRELVREVLDRAGLDPEARYSVASYISRIDELTNRGQVLDVYLSTLPLEKLKKEDILGVYYYKTAIYSFNGPLGLGALLAGDNPNLFYDFAVPLGLAFQIKDDILGAFGDPEKTGKPVGSDIREGKRTLLVFYAWQQADSKQKKILERVLGNSSAPVEEIETVKEIFVDTGALERAREEANKLVEQAIEALDRLPVSEKEILLDLARFVVARDR